MKYLVLLMLAAGAPPAKADCYPQNAALAGLLESQYALVATFEQDHRLTGLFVDPRGDWTTLTFDGETACFFAQGRGFHLVPEKKA